MSVCDVVLGMLPFSYLRYFDPQHRKERLLVDGDDGAAGAAPIYRRLGVENPETLESGNRERGQAFDAELFVCCAEGFQTV